MNVLGVKDNILRHKGGPSDHIGSQEMQVQGCKIGLITHPKPCNGWAVVFP